MRAQLTELTRLSLSYPKIIPEHFISEEPEVIRNLTIHLAILSVNIWKKASPG